MGRGRWEGGIGDVRALYNGSRRGCGVGCDVIVDELTGLMVRLVTADEEEWRGLTRLKNGECRCCE